MTDARTRTLGGQLHDERGDIILHGLLRTIAGLLVVGVLVFEVASIVVNNVQLDDAARAATRAAAQSYSERRTTAAASEAALASLSLQQGMTLESVDVTGNALSLTVGRDASVLFVDRIGPLAGYAHGSVTKTRAWNS